MDESVETYRENMAPESKYTTNFMIKAYAVDYNGEKVKDLGFIEGLYFEAESLFSEEISFEPTSSSFVILYNEITKV